MRSIKSRVAILITVICLVAVVATVSIATVIASRNVSVSSGISASYVAKNVKAKVCASKQIGSGSVEKIATDGGDYVIVFDGTESTNGVSNKKSFSAISVELSGKNTSLTLTYSIQNDADAVNSISVYLGSNPDTANDNLTYSYSVSLSTGSTATTGTTYDSLVSGLGAGETATISITITIADLDYDVNLSGGALNFVMVGV